MGDRPPSPQNSKLDLSQERGRLCDPLHPLNFQDHQTVQVQLLDSEAPSLLSQLRDSGLVTIATPTPENAISDRELEAFV